MLKIWGRTNSINVQKVMWTVGELGLKPERVDAGMAHGIVNEAWYATYNPNRLVPTIEDDGLVLWESNVIVRYLAAKHAPGTLMPTDPAGRAKAEMWMDWQQSTIMPGALTPLFLGLIRTPPEKRDADALRKAAEATEHSLRKLDAHLAKQPYVLGDSLTVADIPVGVATYRWYALPVQHAELPNLRGWYDRLRQRPAFTQHVMLPLS
jgi:glutathione S-transferase